MYAVRDKRTGKYLKDFSGSLKKLVGYGKNVKEKLDKAFCRDSPNGAKLYRSQRGVTNSFQSITMSEQIEGKFVAVYPIVIFPWLEIVPVQVKEEERGLF